MKRCLLALVLILYCAAAFGTGRISFKLNKPVCLLTFLRTAGGDPNMSRTFAAYIRKNIPPEDSAEFYGLVRRYQQIDMENNYVFPQYPQQRQRPRTTMNLINIAAVQSDGLDDFCQRIIGILPNEQWLQLCTVLRKAEPLYHKMIETPYGAAINHQLAELNQYDSKANNIFDRLKQFYGSTWSDAPFTICVYPVPGRKGNTTATPHSNSIVLAVLTDETDYTMRTGVAIHELCHVLYEEQPLALQVRIDSLFRRNSSLYSTYAYNYIDEALATAWGNGWAYEQLSGKKDTCKWYDDAYISGFAKAIYPMTKEYIEAGKTIDQAFIDQAITLFGRTFPQAAFAYSNLLNRIHLYTDAEGREQFGQVNAAVSSHFTVSSSYGSYPITDPQSLSAISESEGTQLILIHKRNKENYKALQKKFPQLKTSDAAKEGIISFIDDKKRPVIIVNVSSMSRLNDGIARLAETKSIDPNKIFTPLN